MFAIKDELSAYAMPLPFESDETAIRYFKYQCQTGIMADSPKDFSIWNIGTYETEKGLIEGHEPRLIIRAEAIK